jgi:hypothetical protein
MIAPTLIAPPTRGPRPPTARRDLGNKKGVPFGTPLPPLTFTSLRLQPLLPTPDALVMASAGMATAGTGVAA